MLLNIVIFRSKELTEYYRDQIRGQDIGLDALFANKSDQKLRQDVHRIYQVVQEPGTLNFVKSKIAVDKNMKELENRTILQKYGIQEVTMFLHLNDLLKGNRYIEKLNDFSYYKLIDVTVPAVNQILFTFYRTRIYIYEYVTKELWLYDVP